MIVQRVSAPLKIQRAELQRMLHPLKILKFPAHKGSMCHALELNLGYAIATVFVVVAVRVTDSSKVHKKVEKLT